MQITAIEEQFIQILRANAIENLVIKRNENGYLIVSVASPCEEIGYLAASMGPDEIMLHCKITHTHFNARDFTEQDGRDPTQTMLLEAAQEFIDFVHGKIAASKEYSCKGDLISSGWGRLDVRDSVNEDYKKLIESPYGGPSINHLWIWTGKIQ